MFFYITRTHNNRDTRGSAFARRTLELSLDSHRKNIGDAVAADQSKVNSLDNKLFTLMYDEKHWKNF